MRRTLKETGRNWKKLEEKKGKVQPDLSVGAFWVWPQPWSFFFFFFFAREIPF